MASFLRPSRSRVVFGQIMRFDPSTTSPEDIRDAAQQAIASMSGWPVADVPAPMADGSPSPQPLDAMTQLTPETVTSEALGLKPAPAPVEHP